jgi:hypothetical protein
MSGPARAICRLCRWLTLSAWLAVAVAAAGGVMLAIADVAHLAVECLS